VHLACEKFHGLCASDVYCESKGFEDITSGRDSDTNDGLSSKNEYDVEKIIRIKENCLYYE
jgi:hypothetical protein